MGVQGAKPPEALKSLQFTLPEVVKKSILVGHFFYVLDLKVTEKIVKIQNKVVNVVALTSLNFFIKCLLNTQQKYSTHPPQYTIHVEQRKS